MSIAIKANSSALAAYRGSNPVAGLQVHKPPVDVNAPLSTNGLDKIQSGLQANIGGVRAGSRPSTEVSFSPQALALSANGETSAVARQRPADETVYAAPMSRATIIAQARETLLAQMKDYKSVSAPLQLLKE